MKRKIIKQGRNTLTVTLPSEWARRFNLEAGKEIDIDEKDNGLFISTKKENTHKKAEFDITGMDVPTIWKYFMAAYRGGCEELTVRFDPKTNFDNPYKFHSKHRLSLKENKQRDRIGPIEALQNFVRRFIDLEIVEQGKDYVIIKEMGEPTTKEFDNALRRIFLLISQMAEETSKAIQTNDPKTLPRMHDIDVNLDKFRDYCVRILNRIGNKNVRETTLLSGILHFLELIGDEFNVISHYIIYDFDASKGTLKNLVQLADSTKKQINEVYDLFYKFDKSKLLLISELDLKIYTSAPETYKKLSEDEKEIFHHLRVINRYINSIMELRIEMEF